MTRWLHERDASRDAGDKLALAVLRHIAETPDAGLAAALIDYHNEDGPAWALPPGDFAVTRYDWSRHLTIPVAVFADKASAENERARLIAAEDKARADAPRNGQTPSKPHHYAVARKGAA